MRAWVLRQDSPSKRIIRPWWTVRSMIAAAMSGSPNTLPYPPDSMLVVQTMLWASYALATTWNRSLLHSSSMGT